MAEQLLAENEEVIELREEVKRLNLEVKRLAREARVSKSFLEKVTRASEAKDTLGMALSAANARQKAYTDVLLESCPEIIALLDEHGRFVLSTKSLLLAAGIPNFDFIKNRSYEEVLSGYFTIEDLQIFKNTIESTKLSDDIASFDAWVDFSQNGFPRYYSIELRRVGGGESGIVAGTLVVMIDLTDLILEKQRAEQASNAKSDFLAMMSHEMRTPMNAILGMSTALDRLGLAPEHQRYITDIRRASGSLLNIINDVLDFSKIEAGKMEIVNVNYNLTNLLDNLHSMFSGMCRDKRLVMHFDKSAGLPATARGDENRIRQVLVNLLSNAVKYTQRGVIAFSAWLEDDNLYFEVTDTGIGIREEDIGRLFTPFEQLDTRRNRNIVGTGLGLAIGSNLCRLMNGEITAKSVYGEGSVFTMRLPYLEACDSAEEEIIEISDFIAPGAKILVVDDIETNLTVAEVMLDIFEIVPNIAHSGQEAIELARHKDFDIIFMDHMMPEMDGLEATLHIRGLGGKNAMVPIVALTANAIKGTEQMFLGHGMDDILLKPLEFEELNLCLRKWLPKEIIEEEM
ncbi:MAG: response regulator [Clostridiales bacterium]|jgi:signal transduction histidine kinase/ActR/RegA family two-component response regulator|nr:response regulator [Clostridiales bacterium]